MRRPALSHRQRQHAREQRALLRLRRSSVQLTDAIEREEFQLAWELGVDLERSAIAYTNALTTRERKQLAKAAR